MFEVLYDPVPHIVVESKKSLTAWPASATECVPRLLANPYSGCSHDCLFCYAKAIQGHFAAHGVDGCVAVYEGLDRNIERALLRTKATHPVQLSPATDPFQPVNARYELAERIIGVVTRRGIPVDVLTKGRYSDEALRLMARHPYSIGQVTILTTRENVRTRLMSGGATTSELFENLTRLRSTGSGCARAGIFTVVRVDPIIPGLTDDVEDLRAVIREAAAAGAQHVIASVMRVPYRMQRQVFRALAERGIGGAATRALYTDRFGFALHPTWSYRKPLFDALTETATRSGMTFALCREYAWDDGAWVGLNHRYCTAETCEGRRVPEADGGQRGLL